MSTRFRTVLALFAGALLIPAAGHAYVVLKTQTTQKELHFRTLPQEFFLSDEGSDDITGTGAFDALVRAFQSWEDVPESDARFSNFSAVNMDAGDIYRDQGDPARDRKNLVAWTEDTWPEDVAQLALTYSYYVEATGKLLECDIAMNGVDYTWTVGETGIESDLESIAAHEIGHSFGLGHSLEPEATMFSTAAQGETKKRSLSTDDMAAVQHSYPPGCCKSTKTQEALAFFGCSMAPGAARRTSAAAGLVLAAGICATALLRRRSARGAALTVALLTIPLAAGTAEASVARALSLEDMSVSADAVVRGRVIHVQALTSPGGTIVTLSQIEVDEVLAGEAPPVVTVLEPGGEPGDTGVGMRVSGTASFEVGEEVVVFARPARNGYERQFPDTWRPVAMSQGKFRVVRDEAMPARVVRDVSGVARVELGHDGRWTEVAGDALSGIELDVLAERVVRARIATPR